MSKSRQRHLSLSELTIEIRWEDCFSFNEIQTLFSIVPFRDTEKSDTPSQICLIFEKAHERFTPLSDNLRLTNSYGLSFYHGKNQTTITDGNSVFAINHHAGKGRIAFHRSFREKPLLDKSNFFLVGLIHLFAQYGYYDLHGAGLSSNGEGYLLLGPSGSGKSSLALNLVRQGWAYASDDALLMNANKKDISLISFRKNFFVDPSVMKRIPELDRSLGSEDRSRKDKHFIDLDEIWPNRFKPQIIPKKIIFCQLSGREDSDIQPIMRKDALLRLLPQSVSIFFNQLFAQEQIKALKRLVEQTECYLLDAGVDVYNDHKKAAVIISDV